jgi:hypothetical protein
MNGELVSIIKRDYFNFQQIIDAAGKQNGGMIVDDP